MGAQGDRKDPVPPRAAAATPEPQPKPRAERPAPDGELADLMAPGAAPDLEQQALAAAEAALLEGQQALAAADAELAAAAPAPEARRLRGRETALRIVLAVNLLALASVVFWPQPAAPLGGAGEPAPPPARDPVVRAPAADDPVIRAFAAADQGDYRLAIRLLEEQLAAAPQLPPGKRANLLLALGHYAAQIGDLQKEQDCERKVEALRSSHSLPEDLVAMAAEAERTGDVESMRRCYARLLLQQRQIPSSLYRHVAEAYLKLGDSYRQEADRAAAAAAAAELEQLRQQLRAQEDGGGGGK